jgi:hypothetical protein
MGGVLFMRRKGSHELRRIVARPFHEVRTEEDLHRFLEADPSLIARGISEGEPLPTIVVASHLKLDRGELDLLLLDAEGEVKVAELKRGRTPRSTVAQTLDYAAQVTSLGFQGLAERDVDWDAALEDLNGRGEAAQDLDADKVRLRLQRPRLLIVAYEIDEATDHIAEFLRGMGVPVYCIEFEYFSDDDYEYYYPRVIGAEEVRQIKEGELTPAQRRNLDLWETLLDGFNKQRPGVTRRRPSKDSWLGLPVGLGRAHLEWSLHGRDPQSRWFEVGFHLEHTETAKNLSALEWLRAQREKLEGVVGEELQFEEWGERWARVYARLDATEIDENLEQWAVQAMVRFYDAVEQLDVVAQLRKLGW